MPTYKLSYFNMRGRAEVTRILFELAGIEYEDKRYEPGSEEWNQFKTKTPLGQLPLLEVTDGNKTMHLYQSITIARYVAAKTGFAGKTDMDKAKADMIVDDILDVVNSHSAIFMSKEEGKEEKMKEFIEKKFPLHLKKLNDKAKGGTFIGGELTWADIIFYQSSTWFDDHCPVDWAKSYPNLAAVIDKVKNNPKVAAWIQKRPKTKM